MEFREVPATLGGESHLLNKLQCDISRELLCLDLHTWKQKWETNDYYIGLCTV